MRINKNYLHAASVIMAEHFMLNRAQMMGFSTFREYWNYLRENKDKISLDLKEEYMWPGPGLADDAFRYYHKFWGETPEEALAVEPAYPDVDIWACNWAYDEMILMLMYEFKGKWDLKDKWTKLEKEELVIVKKSIYASVSYKGYLKGLQNRTFREYNVSRYEDIPHMQDYYNRKSEEEKARDAELAERNKIVDKFKEETYVVLTDHPRWRAIAVSELRPCSNDEEFNLKVMKHRVPNLTQAEYEAIVAAHPHDGEDDE